MANHRPPDVFRLLEAVATIPAGVVATYGEVAARAGLPGRARLVGTVLAAIGDDTLPWHRVVNASRRISVRGEAAIEQRRRLQREGVVFDDLDRIERRHFCWATHTIARRVAHRASPRVRHR